MTDFQRRAARVAASVIVGATAALWPGLATAAVVQRQLQFTCSTRYGSTTVTAQVEADAPDSVVVGEPVAGVVLNATATADPVVSFGLSLIGATSVEGSADAVVTVAAPQVDRTLTVRLIVPDTRVPASGQVTIGLAGTTPEFDFPGPGTATISLDSLTAHMTPVTSSGTTPVGTVDASCTLDPGYSNVLYAINVTPPAPASTPATSAKPTPAQQRSAPPIGTTTSNSTLSAPPSASTTATATVTPARSTSSGPVKTPIAGESSLGSLLGVSGVAKVSQGPAPTAGGSDVMLAAALGAVAVCGSAAGGFFWLRHRRRSPPRSGRNA